jgi:hypothetical protein
MGRGGPPGPMRGPGRGSSPRAHVRRRPMPWHPACDRSRGAARKPGDHNEPGATLRGGRRPSNPRACPAPSRGGFDRLRAPCRSSSGIGPDHRGTRRSARPSARRDGCRGGRNVAPDGVWTGQRLGCGRQSRSRRTSLAGLVRLSRPGASAGRNQPPPAASRSAALWARLPAWYVASASAESTSPSVGQVGATSS